MKTPIATTAPARLTAFLLTALLLTAFSPATVADSGMMDDPKKMAAMKSTVAVMDKASAMMKKAMADKDDAMARESIDMMKKALAEWNKGDPMKGF
jgi:hypothetical protein